MSWIKGRMTLVTRNGGKPSVAIAFSLTDDANAVETLGKIKAKVAEDAKSFPEDMTYSINTDNTDFINASIGEVIETFFEALLLVALIVYVFLQNWRFTLIPDDCSSCFFTRNVSIF